MKIFFSFILLIPLFFTVANPAQAQSKLTFGTLHYPPYEIENPQGGLKGFDYEVVEEAFKRMKIPMEIQFLPWKRAVQMGIAGVNAGVFSCAKRKAFYNSHPISTATDALYMRKNFDSKKFPIKTIDDLLRYPELKVGAVSGYKHVELLDQKNIPYDVSPTDEAAFKKLFAERIDVFLTIKEFANYSLRLLGLSTLSKHTALGQKEYYLCFSKSWDQAKLLKDHFNRTLEAIKRDGTYDLIHDKYR